MKPNCALDKHTLLCLYVPGFQRQVSKHVEILSERSKEMKNRRRTRGAFFLRNPLTFHKRKVRPRSEVTYMKHAKRTDGKNLNN